MKDLSIIAASLTALTREDHPFKLNWGTLEQNAFDTLKQAIVAAPMLKFLDYSKEIRVRTDASKIGIGAVLFQVIEGAEEPMAFSPSLSVRLSRRGRPLSTNCSVSCVHVRSGRL